MNMRAVDRLSWQSSAQTPLSELNQDAGQGHSAAAGFPASLCSDQQRRTAKCTKYAQRKQAGKKEEEEKKGKQQYQVPADDVVQLKKVGGVNSCDILNHLPTVKKKKMCNECDGGGGLHVHACLCACECVSLCMHILASLSYACMCMCAHMHVHVCARWGRGVGRFRLNPC